MLSAQTSSSPYATVCSVTLMIPKWLHLHNHRWGGRLRFNSLPGQQIGRLCIVGFSEVDKKKKVTRVARVNGGPSAVTAQRGTCHSTVLFRIEKKVYSPHDIIRTIAAGSSQNWGIALVLSAKSPRFRSNQPGFERGEE